MAIAAVLGWTLAIIGWVVGYRQQRFIDEHVARIERMLKVSE